MEVLGMISLPTPAGNNSLDYAVLFSINGSNVLLEIKGNIYYGSEKSLVQFGFS